MKASAVLFNIAILTTTLCFSSIAQAETPSWCSIAKSTLSEVYRKYNIVDPTHAGYAVRDFEAALPSLPREIGKSIIDGIVQGNGGERYEAIPNQNRAEGYLRAFERIIKNRCEEKKDPTEKLLAPPTNLRVM